MTKNKLGNSTENTGSGSCTVSPAPCTPKPSEEGLELRSEEVQDILSRPPRWLVRWGITVLFVVVAGLFTGSYFFNYPDILKANIIVTTEHLPAGVTAKTAGRIDTVFVTEKQFVRQGDMLAYIENPARLASVMALQASLSNFSPDSLNQQTHTHTPLSQWRGVGGEVGDLQPAYNTFLKTYEEYAYFLTADYHNKKIAVIEKQITIQTHLLQKSTRQLNIAKKQYAGAQKVFEADSVLFAKNVIAALEFETSKSLFLQQQQSYESAKINIDNQQMNILQLEQSIFDLQQQREEQEQTLKTALTAARDQLSAQISTWEQTYLLTASTSGIISFTKYWQKNQNIRSGEVLVTIVPAEKTKIIGKIYLPPQGAGKVKAGQEVNVKLDNFPYMEYGMVRVKISHISLVPVEDANGNKSYILEVDFPEELTTNYGKTLEFTQEMTGTAEIITENLRLIDRFLNPIKAVIKR